MVTIDCPWCEETAQLPFPLPDEAGATFSCTDCGIDIEWAEEPLALDLAA
jgi:sarcosine oxidase delta subunit